MLGFDSGIIYIVLAILAAIVVVGVIVGRYKVSSPSEAFVVSGARSKSGDITSSSRVVLGGGGVFVLPFLQHLYRVSLEQKQISFSVESAVSQSNILVTLTGVASIKVGGDEGAVRSAAQRFLGQQERIDEYTKEVLEGSLRAIVGTMTVDAINRERAKFASQVAEIAASDLGQQGLQIDTLQIKNVTTPESGYIVDLGRPEAAKVKQEAEIAEAKARQAAQEEAAKADIAIAEANRALELRNAEIQSETEAARANAAAAGPIAEATRRQEILAQERLAAERQAEVRERQLEAEVIKPADARAYETKVAAEAERDAEIARANAEAERIKVLGDAEAGATKAKGDAEAAAIKARSDAYENYPEAGVLDIALERMPAIVREAAAPIGAIDNLTVVSSDGMNSVSKGATSLLTETAATVKAVSGVDINSILSGATAGFAAGASKDKSNGETLAADAKQKAKTARETIADAKKPKDSDAPFFGDSDKTE